MKRFQWTVRFPVPHWLPVGAICLVGLLAGCEKPVRLGLQMLEACTGHYQADTKTIIIISRLDDHLRVEVNGGAPLDVFAKSEVEFFHKESSTKITFVKNAAGQVTHFVLNRDGVLREAKRIADIDAKEQPLTVMTVMIGPNQFRMLATGNGQPTVILWGGSAGWHAVQKGVEKFTRVVSFDRENAGSAKGKAEFHTPGEAARELHAALEKSKMRPPYVLVGHSFGGALTRAFASEYPKEIVGMVLVDPFQEEFLDWLKLHQPKNYDQFVSRGRQVYVSDWENSLAELRRDSLSPDVPVVLLSAGARKQRSDDALEQSISSSEFTEGRRAVLQAHKDWLAKIAHGKHVEVADSSHQIPTEQPEIIVDSIKEIVGQIQSSQP